MGRYGASLFYTKALTQKGKLYSNNLRFEIRALAKDSPFCFKKLNDGCSNLDERATLTIMLNFAEILNFLKIF